MALAQVPAVGAAGWFTLDDGQPALIGSRCSVCGNVSFPPTTTTFCPNPDCSGGRAEAVPLSRRGTIWSYTDAQYEPPPPYVAPADPYEPFAIAAVELAAEGLVVLGQMARGVTVEDVHVGTEVEVVVEPLFADGEHEYLVWKWRPVT